MGMVLFATCALELRAAEHGIALSEEELDAVVKDIDAVAKASIKATKTGDLIHADR